MEILGNPVVRILGALVVVTLASALVQRMSGRNLNWLRALSLGIGLAGAIALADFLSLTGLLRLAAMVVFAFSIVALAGLVPALKLRAKSDA